MASLKKIPIVTVYNVGPAPFDKFFFRGTIWRIFQVPYWKLAVSGSYRIWNYVWGEDPEG